MKVSSHPFDILHAKVSKASGFVIRAGRYKSENIVVILMFVPN